MAEAETARNRLLKVLEEAEKASQAAEQALAAAKSEKGAADRAVEKAVTVKKRRMGGVRGYGSRGRICGYFGL